MVGTPADRRGGGLGVASSGRRKPEEVEDGILMKNSGIADIDAGEEESVGESGGRGEEDIAFRFGGEGESAGGQIGSKSNGRERTEIEESASGSYENKEGAENEELEEVVLVDVRGHDFA